MKKTIHTIGIILIILMSNLSIASAYIIPEEYTPDNTPFPAYDNQGWQAYYDQDVEGVANSTNIILRTLAGALLYFAAPLAVLVIVLAAFKLVMGGAETDQVEQGKKQLTWAILGLLLIMLSYSLTRILIQTAIMAGNPTTTEEAAAGETPAAEEEPFVPAPLDPKQQAAKDKAEADAAEWDNGEQGDW